MGAPEDLRGIMCTMMDSHLAGQHVKQASLIAQMLKVRPALTNMVHKKLVKESEWSTYCSLIQDRVQFLTI